MSVLLLHFIFFEKIIVGPLNGNIAYCLLSEVALPLYRLTQRTASTEVFISSLHPFVFFFQGTVSKARFRWSSWQSLAATCARNSPSNGRNFNTHKGKTVQGVGFATFS